jgi:hypothetical protein
MALLVTTQGKRTWTLTNERERAVVPSSRRHGHHVRVHHISGLDRVEVNGELRCILVQEPKHVELTEGGDGDVSLRVNTRI